MQMQIYLVAGFKYVSGMTQIPVRVMISSVQPVEIADKIHISSAGLVRPGDRGFFLGFSRMTTAVVQGSKTLDNDHPYRIALDLLEDTEQHEPLRPGPYEVQVEAMVFRKTAGGFAAETIKGKLPLEVGS